MNNLDPQLESWKVEKSLQDQNEALKLENLGLKSYIVTCNDMITNDIGGKVFKFVAFVCCASLVLNIYLLGK
jgi:hypothetical protein